MLPPLMGARLGGLPASGGPPSPTKPLPTAAAAGTAAPSRLEEVLPLAAAAAEEEVAV